MLATHGWQEQTEVSAISAGKRFAAMGVKHIVFTDIARDGKLEGPNIAALIEMTKAVHADIIASGGVSSLADLTRIRRARAAGVIVGAALYHGRFTLTEALAITNGETV
jgi:phosphoribosylformimino-5-aminoimidazole carboxamide ribotide isomerase